MSSSTKSALIIIALAVLIAGIVAAWVGTSAYKSGYSAGKASVVITERRDTVTFAVLVHDTTRVPVKVTRIVQAPTIVLKPGSAEPANDTATCYAWSKIEPDSSKITARVCSDSLPLHIAGLQADIEYVGPAVRSREIWTRDTLRIDVPRPTIDWRWPVVTFCAGIATAAIVELARKK